MKKYFGIISCAAIVIAATTFTSCNGQNTSGKVELKNKVDSVSYIAGVSEAKRNGLPDVFAQIGIEGFEEDFIKGFSKGFGIKEDDKKSIAHIIGLQFGYGMNTQMIAQLNKYVFGNDSTKSVDKDLIKAGLIDIIRKNEISENLNDSLLAALVEQIKAEANKDAIAINTKFLEDNKAKEGVVVLPSGLQYKVITEGTGPKPTVDNKVKVHYHGTTIDGTVFDSSVERGEPTEFGVTQVIKGWTEGLQLMPVGSKYMFYIPYDLAYGENGAGDKIGPYSALIFEVELLDIVE